MIDFLVAKIHDVHFMTMLFAAIAVGATAYTLVMPLFAGDGLAKRMKAVASERERIRQRERERLSKTEKVSLRQTPKQVVSKVVEDFNLGKWLAQEAARDKLVMAGYRGQAPYITFLFFRLVTPIVLFLARDALCLRDLASAAVAADQDRHLRRRRLSRPAGADAVPEKRDQQAPALDQARLSRCARSAADLHRVRHVDRDRVPQGRRPRSCGQSIALSEEFTLTTAELSYLQDRKVAYENLAKRTGLEGVKSVCLALMQSERYGTPLGQSLRVMAQENRDMRMNEAEKKAAALPPKLTVPMILFFLPVLFVVILGPTGIKVAAMQ